MQKIKITKTIEELDLFKATELCLKVLKRPGNIPQNDWANQVKNDLISGKKFLKIRELVIKENL